MPVQLGEDGQPIVTTDLPPELAVIPMITSSISVWGSYTLLRELTSDYRLPSNQRSRLPIIRALMGLSMSDIVLSIALGLSTVPSPADIDYTRFNVGTTTTCEIQGFFAQMGNVSTPIFSTTLSYFYVLVINRRKSDQEIFRIEKWLYPLTLGLALVCAIFPLSLDLYNNAYHVCWINAHPEGCDHLGLPCERGESFNLWATVFTIFPLWVCVFLTGYHMFVLWRGVRRVEDRAAKYNGNSHDVSMSLQQVDCVNNNSQTTGQQQQESSKLDRQVDRTKSRAVAWQGTGFVVAFFLVQFPRMFAMLHWVISKKSDEGLHVLAYDILLPLQGFFNALVFTRSRQMHTPEGRFFARVVAFPCLWKNRFENHRFSSSILSSGNSKKGEQPSNRNTHSQTMMAPADSLHTRTPGREGIIQEEEEQGERQSDSSSSLSWVVDISPSSLQEQEQQCANGSDHHDFLSLESQSTIEA